MDKIERLEKILKKKGFKGLVKPVHNLEKSHFVIIENPNCITDSLIIKTEGFNKLIDRFENLPEELIHYAVIINKRDQKTAINKLVSNIFFLLSKNYKL